MNLEASAWRWRPFRQRSSRRAVRAEGLLCSDPDGIAAAVDSSKTKSPNSRASSSQRDARPPRLYFLALAATAFVILQAALFFLAGFYARFLFNGEEGLSERETSERYRLEPDVWESLFGEDSSSLWKEKASAAEDALEKAQAESSGFTPAEFERSTTRPPFFAADDFLSETWRSETSLRPFLQGERLRQSGFAFSIENSSAEAASQATSLRPFFSSLEKRRLMSDDETREGKDPPSGAGRKRQSSRKSVLAEGRLHLDIPSPSSLAPVKNLARLQASPSQTPASPAKDGSDDSGIVDAKDGGSEDSGIVDGKDGSEEVAGAKFRPSAAETEGKAGIGWPSTSAEKKDKNTVATDALPSPEEETALMREAARTIKNASRPKSTSFESVLPRRYSVSDEDGGVSEPDVSTASRLPLPRGGLARSPSRRFAFTTSDKTSLAESTASPLRRRRKARSTSASDGGAEELRKEGREEPPSPHVDFGGFTHFTSEEPADDGDDAEEEAAAAEEEALPSASTEPAAADGEQTLKPSRAETASPVASSDVELNLQKEIIDESTQDVPSSVADSPSGGNSKSKRESRRRSPGGGTTSGDEETGDVYDEDDEPGSDDNIEGILRQLSRAGQENADSILEDEDFDARVAQGNQRLFKASQFKPSLRRDLPRFGPSHSTAKQRMRTALRQRLLTNGATRLQAEKERLLRGAEGKSGAGSLGGFVEEGEGTAASGEKRKSEGEWAAVPVGLSALVMNEIRNKLEKMFLRIRKHESFRRRLSIPPQPRGMYNPYVKDFVCDKFRNSEVHQFWLTMLVIYAFEWPAYAFTAKGGKEFLVELVKTVRAEQQSKVWAEMKACGMQSAFIQGIAKLEMVESGGDLEQILSLAYERHREFQRAVRAFGSLHIPKNETSSVVHVFSLVLDTCMIVWGEELFSGREETQVDFKPYTWNEMYLNFVVKQMEARTYYYDALLLRRVLKQHVTSRPYNGVLILLVKNFVEDEFAGVSSGPLDMLEAQVRQSVKMKLERSTRRFWNDSFSGEEVNVKNLDIPEVRVAGYYAKAPQGQVLEKGLLGLEMAPSVVEALKTKLAPRNVLIQVSLLDAWADMPEELWPDAFEDAGAVVTAHAAMQMLKMEFMWDPRLPILEETPTGHTAQLLSSSLVPVFGQEPMESRRRQFDPDIQVIMMQHEENYKLIAASGGICNYVLQLVLRKAYGHQGIVRHLDPERIQYQGSAWWLGGQPGMGTKIFRKGIFGRGMNHKKILKIESSLRHDCIMVHIKICGLGEASATTDLQELTAIEVLNRLVQRARGNFEFHVDFGNYPTAMAVPLRAPEKKCEGVVPLWMLAVAVGSAFLFFAIVLGLLMHHGRVDVPWWLACWCSRFSPWERGALAALENNARRRSSEEGRAENHEGESLGKAGGGDEEKTQRKESLDDAASTFAGKGASSGSAEAAWRRSKTVEERTSSPTWSLNRASSTLEVAAASAFGVKVFNHSDSAWVTAPRHTSSLKRIPPKPPAAEPSYSDSASPLGEDAPRNPLFPSCPRTSSPRRVSSCESSLSGEGACWPGEKIRRSSSGRDGRSSWRPSALTSRALMKLHSVPVRRRSGRSSRSQPSVVEQGWPEEASSEKPQEEETERRASFARRTKSHTPQISEGESGESAESLSFQQKRKARAALASLSRQQSKRQHYVERLKHGASVRDPIILAPFDQFPGDV